MLTANAIKALEARYLIQDSHGKVIETVDELFWRVARCMAQAETENITEWSEKFYQQMQSLKFLPNSPTLMNAGRPLGMLSACFVLPLEDSLDSVFTTLRDAAITQKAGGGCGFSFGKLRPKGDAVRSTSRAAGGPVEFLKIFDRSLECIKQGGTRHGANMAVMHITHPDVIEFIHCKRKEGDIQNFNISVAISDEFMYALRHNNDHHFVNPRTGAMCGKIPSKELFNMIVENAWHNGEPGIIFIDEVNRHNPTPHVGMMHATNPCGEQPLLPNEACNLGSVNLAKFVTNSKIDYMALEETTRIATRFLDNVVEMNRYPTPSIETLCKANRKVGLGVMGFADMLIKMGIDYDSEQAVVVGGTVMRFINEKATEESEKLADEKGVFPNYYGSLWHTTRARRVRNATLTTVAPTGTLSLIANCSSGIEPRFGKSITKNILGGAITESIDQELDNEYFIDAARIRPETHVRIQAAFQAHVHAAISKTCNLPNDASKDDVRTAYIMAHNLKCKSITVYRDGSREKQVLVRDTTKATTLTDDDLVVSSCPTGGCTG